MLEVAGREVRLSIPARSLPSPAGRSSTWSSPTSAAADAVLTDCRAPDRGRSASSTASTRSRSGGSGCRERPGLAADRDGGFPAGRTAEELVANDKARLAWAVNLGVIDFNPHPVPPQRPRPSGRVARQPRPDPEDRLDRGPQARDGRRRGADRARPARLPEGLRLQGHPRQRAGSSRSTTTSRSTAPRSRWPARSSAARRPGHQQVVEEERTASSSTTTRTRATAPSPPATGCGPRRTRACPARWPGTRCPTPNPATCGWTPSRSA